MDNLLARTWPTFVRNVRPIPYVCIHRRNWRDVALLMAVGPTIKRPYRSLYFIFHFFATPYDKKNRRTNTNFTSGATVYGTPSSLPPYHDWKTLSYTRRRPRAHDLSLGKGRNAETSAKNDLAPYVELKTRIVSVVE